MKFRIRYADQIVGLLIIIAILSIAVIIFLIGRTQQWFTRTYLYKTYAASAAGLTENMAVNCRGFPIGNVKSFNLTDDNQVVVLFTIRDKFRGRAREGSLAEIQVSPIGLGSTFVFYPGLGGDLEEGSLVPMRDSPEGKAYIAQGIGYIPSHDDSIAVLLATAQAMLEDIDSAVSELNVTPDGKVDGRTAAALGQTIANIQRLTANLSEDMANPNGIRRIINGEGDVASALFGEKDAAALDEALVSLAGILGNLDKATAILPREMPAILIDVRTTLQAVDDVLIALRNNPILRNGIPEHAEIDSSGTNPRNISF